MIELKNINLIYDLNKEIKTYAIKSLDMVIESNKFYGILGPSGSGKSSLLYVMSGLKKPTTGKVFFNDTNMHEISENELCNMRKKEFGFVFQKHFLIDYLTVLQNVLVPLNSFSKELKDEAIELLNALGLKDQIHKKPHQLSGGQCQRVAIARALIHKPKVIFADEITASLDMKNALLVMDVLKKYRKDATLVVVTHDPSILEGADEIIMIRDGILVERSDMDASA